MHMDEVRAYITATNEVISLLRNLTSLLPKGGKDADDANRSLAEAERALRASEAQLAKSLGYKLCQCDFPPNIMLSKGNHPVHGTELFQCRSCGKQDPSEAHMKGLDRMKAQNDALDVGGWMGR